ncbi:MAG TPA: PH domain-containing protein [Leeuwenhoekiella sp.]|nr:PH domain-containing protein [Leeuwenhoekiella sp.]
MSIFSSILGNAGTVEPEKLKQEYADLLIPDEEIQIGFKLLRDTFIFTTKRLILIDKQGITGKKLEYLSINYKSISRFSIETAGTFDLDAELKIWISSESHPSISRRFNKSVNVYEVQRLLAKNVLN